MNIDIILLININILLKNIDLLDIVLNIDILALNIGILPDILNNDILSSYWKRGKYKMFILSRIQTEAIKQMVAGESCCGEWVVSDSVGLEDRGPRDLFGGVGCTMKILMGARVVDGGSSERCLSGVVGSLRSLS